MSKNAKSTVGKVLAALTVTNRADQITSLRGLIPEGEIRSIALENVLVDTGATTLCLPSEIIEKLGLELLKEVDVATVSGISKARIFQDAKVSLCGREGTFECLELPGGQNPLLGVIPLEMLSLEPDLQNQTLRVLPDKLSNTYITIL